MKELENLFEALYSRFVMRDVFGKMVPGATLLVALYVVLIRPDASPDQVIRLITSARTLTWLVLGMMGWITAFGIQRLGEFVGLRYYGCWIPDDKSWYKKVIHFTQVASPEEKRGFERFVVIKETCGNAAFSLVLSGIVLLFIWNNKANIFFPAALLLGGIILFSMHRVHVKRNTWWLESVLELRGEPRSGQPYQPPTNNTEKT